MFSLLLVGFLLGLLLAGVAFFYFLKSAALFIAGLGDGDDQDEAEQPGDDDSPLDIAFHFKGWLLSFNAQKLVPNGSEPN